MTGDQKFNWIFHNLEACPSTNLALKNWKDRGCAPVGTVLKCRNQTHGKGRLDRVWESPPGNLSFSFVIPTPGSLHSVYQLNLVVGLTLVEILNHSYSVTSKLKWPNDILIHNQKVSGILSELINDTACIIGVGINFNSTRNDFSQELRSSLTTLKDQSGIALDEKIFYKCFFEQLNKNLNDFYSNGLAFMLSRIRSFLAWMGKKIVVKEFENDQYHAQLLNIDEDGFLLVRTNDGGNRKVVAGEIRVVSSRA